MTFEAYPADLRPILTRHRLRRRRHRSAASLLTGAALALGLAAIRPAPAGAATTQHATRTFAPARPEQPRPPTDREPPGADPAPRSG